MPVPTPRKGENSQDFLSRCIKHLSEIDSKRPRKQIVAICYSSLRGGGRKVTKK